MLHKLRRVLLTPEQQARSEEAKAKVNVDGQLDDASLTMFASASSNAKLPHDNARMLLYFDPRTGAYMFAGAASVTEDAGCDCVLWRGHGARSIADALERYGFTLNDVPDDGDNVWALIAPEWGAMMADA